MLGSPRKSILTPDLKFDRTRILDGLLGADVSLVPKSFLLADVRATVYACRWAEIFVCFVLERTRAD
jgi:hypothetical protein